VRERRERKGEVDGALAAGKAAAVRRRRARRLLSTAHTQPIQPTHRWLSHR
jgi:hypothetical protein